MSKIVLLVCVLLLALPSLAAAQTETPVPPGIVPALPLPTQEMFEQLATANALLDSLPRDLTNDNGRPLLPEDNIPMFMGYLKWLLDPATLDEWLGPFAPILMHVGIGISSLFFWWGIYMTAYTVFNFRGWVTALWEMARKLIDLVLQFFQMSPLIAIAAIIFFIAAVVTGQEGVRAWVEDGVGGLIRWFQCLIVAGQCIAQGGINPP